MGTAQHTCRGVILYNNNDRTRLGQQEKLSCVLKLLQIMRNLLLNLELDGFRMIKWWADATITVHHDMKNHTSGEMFTGNGAAYSALSKQKLNTKSLTESELVGVYDLMSQIIWMQYFWRLRA